MCQRLRLIAYNVINKCCGSITFWVGSWIRILLFSSLTFIMPAKIKFFNTIFSAYYFLKLHLHHFSKIKSQKESQNSRNQGFSYYFCMMVEGSGSGSIPLTSGSGSGRPQNMWIRGIRIQIRNTVINNIKILHFSKSAPSEKFALFLKTSLFFQKLRALLKILALCPKVLLFSQNLGALFKSSALCSKSWRFPPCQGKIC